MPPSPSSPVSSPAAPIPDEPSSALAIPLPLSASIVLTSLPRDAHSALERAVEDVESGVPKKVTIRFQPIGSAPQLRQRIFKISASNNFSTVVNFLRKRLFDSPRAAGGGAEGASKDAGAEGKGEGKGAEASKGKGGEGAGAGGGSVFCYVNSVFAPGLDEGVGALWRFGLVRGGGG